MSSGVQLFCEQIAGEGYSVLMDGDWIEFDYEVPAGTFCGRVVRLAMSVPKDFPVSPPGGIDFKPAMRPPNPSASHPDRSHPSNRFGPEGEYWSRPYPSWNGESDKTAATYMVWVRTLWATT